MFQRSGSIQTERSSLNFTVRKQEHARINRENHIFAKRLFSNVTATIKKQEFDDSYAQASRISRRLQKIPRLEKLEQRSVERAINSGGSVKHDSIFEV